MIDEKTVMQLSYYKCYKPFTGSLDGKRYRIKREKEEDVLRVWIWPEPFAFEHTEESLITTADFSYDTSGYEEMLRYLNEHLVSE